MSDVPGPNYIEGIRRSYSLYVLQQRAIPSICDGLKSAARRVLWVARDGKKIKSASLAGATMPIHPHAPAESTINTLTAPYGNNYPLFDGHGAFGTLITPDAYSASRYTSVSTSEFTNRVMFADIDLVPMQENYDSTLLEPVHFLPLVPTVLLNPTEGIAIGYSCTILPRTLTDVVNAQLQHLQRGQSPTSFAPKFIPTNQTARWVETKTGGKWVFVGKVERVHSSLVRITQLPFGLSHSNLVSKDTSKLNKLLESNIIVDYQDGSKKQFNIEVKFKRSELAKYDDDQLLDLFGLIVNANENLNVLNFDHTAILESSDCMDIIKQFTDWRLTWFKLRYTKLLEQLNFSLQRYRDIITAIDNHAGQVASTKDNKRHFCQWLSDIGVVDVEYIATLPTYRYTTEEREKTAKQLQHGERTAVEYQSIINSDVKQRNIYKQELSDLLKDFT